VTIFASFLAENDWEIAQKAQARGLLEMLQALATVVIFGNDIFVVYLHFSVKFKAYCSFMLNLAGRII